MPCSTQVCRCWRRAGASWLLLWDVNAWHVLQQPWGCGLLGNAAKPPRKSAAKRQCKKRQESELEKLASSHPCYSHVIFCPWFSKAEHLSEVLLSTELTWSNQEVLHLFSWLISCCGTLGTQKQMVEISFRPPSYSQVNPSPRVELPEDWEGGGSQGTTVPENMCSLHQMEAALWYSDLKASLPFMPLWLNQYYKKTNCLAKPLFPFQTPWREHICVRFYTQEQVFQRFVTLT